MQITDAQIHIWAGGVPLPPSRREPYSSVDALRDMDDAGISRAVIYPPNWDPDGKNLAIKAAETHQDRFAVMAYFAPNSRDVIELLNNWSNKPRFLLGLRFVFLDHGLRAQLINDELDWLWSAAQSTNTPIAILASECLPKIGDIAHRFPRLRLLVDHMGTLRLKKGDEAFSNLPQLLALARHDNVAVKATGAPIYSTDAYPFRSIHNNLHRIYDAFGPSRMFWGSDITRMPCTWRQCVTLFTEELPWLSQTDKESIMGRAVRDWLCWSDKPIASPSSAAAGR